MPPAELQRLLRDAIDSVLDVDAFNAEVDRKKRDAAELEGMRRALKQEIGTMGLDGGDRDEQSDPGEVE